MWELVRSCLLMLLGAAIVNLVYYLRMRAKSKKRMR